jgi:RNA polymerase sigma-70 factor (ECF subfamily)
MLRGLRRRSPRRTARDGSTEDGREDREIVAEYLRSRSDVSFHALYDRHAPAMYALALRFLAGRRNEAEDAVQDSWLRALSGLQSFRWESSLRTWLCGIIVNCCRERVRDAWWPVAPPEPPARAPDRTDRLQVEELLSRLPPGYRAVLVLHDIEGYTHREIARLLDIDEGTARSQLSRARATFRRWLNVSTEEQDARRR